MGKYIKIGDYTIQRDMIIGWSILYYTSGGGTFDIILKDAKDNVPVIIKGTREEIDDNYNSFVSEMNPEYAVPFWKAK